MNTIYTIFKKLNLGDVLKIKRVDSNQNIVYQIKTQNKNFILKEYSKDAIKDNNDLAKRNKQLRISEKFNSNGIKTVLPLKFNGHYFILFENKYYLIYEYMNYNVLEYYEVTLDNIITLATTLAKMHELDIQSDLDCQYKIINIDFDNYLELFKDIDSSLYETLNNNIDKLKELINNCNININKVKEIMCISHNDYKLKNILWNDDEMYLIDFDACAISNPIVSLAESSFALSKQGDNINLEYYIKYLETYFSIYNCNTSYKDALMVSMNGKLQWLEYLFSKCSNRDEKVINDSIGMINELVLFISNIDNFLKIYEEIKKIA